MTHRYKLNSLPERVKNWIDNANEAKAKTIPEDELAKNPKSGMVAEYDAENGILTPYDDVIHKKMRAFSAVIPEFQYRHCPEDEDPAHPFELSTPPEPTEPEQPPEQAKPKAKAKKK